MINGATIASQRSERKVGFEVPAIVGSAFAQGVGQQSTVKNCLEQQEPSAKQQILKGVIGIEPDNQWFVVVGSYGTPDGALANANELNRKHRGRYEIKVCDPIGGADVRYRVVVGEYLSYGEATKLKVEAIKAGFPEETWVWNPSDMQKALK